MPDVSMSSIEFEIKGASGKAAESIDRLTDKLNGLKSALGNNEALKNFTNSMLILGQAKNASSTVRSVANALKTIGTSADKVWETAEYLNTISQLDFSNLSEAAKNIRDIGSAAKSFGKTKVSDTAMTAGQTVLDSETSSRSSVVGEMNDIGAAAEEAEAKIKSVTNTNLYSKALSTLQGALKKVGSAAVSAGKALSSIWTAPIKSLTSRVKNAVGAFTKLGAAFKRILFYRAVRTLIKEIGAAFKYGVNNLYAWSNTLGGEFAANMDRIATSFSYFKNSVGAAVAPLINALAPAIDYVIDKAVTLLNVLNQLFARLSGATYWTRATKQATSYGGAVSGAGGAAKEALRYLAPFDELNVLPSNSSGGGGGGGGGSGGSGLFEEVVEFSDSVNDFAAMLKDAWDNADFTEVGEFVSEKLTEALNNIDWDSIQASAEKIGKSIGTFINGVVGNQEFAEALGTTLAEALNTAIDYFDSLYSTINWTDIGTFIATGINTFFSTFDFSEAGLTLDTLVQGFLDAAITATDSENLNWDEFGTKIGEFVSSISWGEIFKKTVNLASNIFTGLLTALVSFTGTLNENGTWDEIGTKIGETLRDLPWSDIFINIGTLGKNILIGVHDAIAAAISAGLGVDDETGALIADAIGVAALVAVIAKLVFGITSLTGGFGKKNDALKDQTSLTEKETSAVSSMVAQYALAPAAIGALVTAFGDLNTETEKSGSVAKNLVTTVQNAYSTMNDAIATTVSNIATNVSTGFSTVKTGVVSTVTSTVGAVSNLFNQMETTMSTVISSLSSSAKTAANTVNTTIATLVENIDIKPHFVSDEKTFKNEVLAFFKEIQSQLQTQFNRLGDLSVTATVEVNVVPEYSVTEKQSKQDVIDAVREQFAPSGVLEGITVGAVVEVEVEPSFGMSDSEIEALKAKIQSNINSLFSGSETVTETESFSGAQQLLMGVLASSLIPSALIELLSGSGALTSGAYAGYFNQIGISDEELEALNQQLEPSGYTHSSGSFDVEANITSWKYGSDEVRSALQNTDMTAKLSKSELGTDWETPYIEAGALWTTGKMGPKFQKGGVNFNQRYIEAGALWTTGKMGPKFQKGGVNFNQRYIEAGALWTTGKLGPKLKKGGENYSDLTIETNAKYTSGTDNIPSSQKYIYGSTAYIQTAEDHIPWIKRILYNFRAAISATTGAATGGVYSNGSWQRIQTYASGGYVGGQLFVAREAGPELVGTLKGHTAVMNNDQIVASVSAGVARAISNIQFHMTGFSPAYASYVEDDDTEESMYRATMRALQALGLTGEAIQNIQAHISSGEVYDSVRASNRANTKMTGVNELA